jgi:hypothetical protein
VKHLNLGKIESSLTPKQDVLVWLEEVAGCQNLEDVVVHLRNQPESTRPLERLPAQVRASIEHSMKGQGKERVRETALRAVRGVAFLIYLYRHANIRVVEDMRARVLLSGFLNERLLRLALQKGYSISRSLKAVLPRRTLQLDAGMEMDWIHSCASFLRELYATRDAVNLIATGYFGGHEILFNDGSLVLDHLISETERSAELFNNVILDVKQMRKWIDPEEVHHESRKEAERIKAVVVCMAKSDALKFMGDDEGAKRLAEQLLELDAQRRSISVSL